MHANELKIHVSGDPKGGWMVDLHDGSSNICMRPTAPDKFEAAHQAIETHVRALAAKAKADEPAEATAPEHEPFSAEGGTGSQQSSGQDLMEGGNDLSAA